MRVSFYAQAAQFFRAQGQEREAGLHRHLADLIRQEKEWKAQKWDAGWQLAPEMAALGKRETLRALEPLWQTWRDKDKVFQQGTIKRILPPGKAGFIHDAVSGMDYYFAFRDVRRQDWKKAVEGAAVRFTLTERENPKRQRREKNAVDITVG